MIRPFTCVCLVLAAASGLYLYQTKHRTLLLDQQIATVLKRADEARARTAVLQTDYARLSDTDRLRALSTRYLSLQPVAIGQYVQLAQLDAHLPQIEDFSRPDPAPPRDPDRPAALVSLADLPSSTVALQPAAPSPAATGLHPAGGSVAPARATPPRPRSPEAPTMLASASPRLTDRAPPAWIAAAHPAPSRSRAGTGHISTTMRTNMPPAPPPAQDGVSMLGQSMQASALAPPVPVAN